VRFRIWARKEAANETQYALQSGIKCIEFYEEFFGIRFPLAKQDMVALPDFGQGAMENWGLITYREKYLLYSPHLYSSRQKLHVTLVVAHELAHQWFGNLVTMKWYVEKYGVFSYFKTEQKNLAFLLDSLF
jgi:aminopeptidase N